MYFKKKITSLIKRQFLSGILVIVPIIITYLVLRFLFQGVDNILSPHLDKLIGFKIPGIGLIATIVLIFLAGVITHSLIGSRLYSIGEILFIKTPLVRTIYSSAKQLVEAVTVTDKKSFKQVVLVEYPRKGVFALGFITDEWELKGAKFFSVFIPNTPTPFTGWVILFPEGEVEQVDISIEDAIKFFVSGGIASPEQFKRKN
jgi:uncharacterized membrane protein